MMYIKNDSSSPDESLFLNDLDLYFDVWATGQIWHDVYRDVEWRIAPYSIWHYVSYVICNMADAWSGNDPIVKNTWN